jgi:Mn-dependent DtxR family transcriptional regulator
MGFSKPSVSVAMKKLRENDLINMDEDGYITLTENGRQAAEQVYERHSILHEWLVSIGVDEKTATVDACRMEHILSPAAFAAIRRQHEKRGKRAKKF